MRYTMFRYVVIGNVHDLYKLYRRLLTIIEDYNIFCAIDFNKTYKADEESAIEIRVNAAVLSSKKLLKMIPSNLYVLLEYKINDGLVVLEKQANSTVFKRVTDPEHLNGYELFVAEESKHLEELDDYAYEVI